MMINSIELDGTVVKQDSRRWHHSLGNALWHTVILPLPISIRHNIYLADQDSSFHQKRSKYSILLSHGNPSEGGSWTHFADTRRAYNDLPQVKKEELEDLVVEHE